MKTRILLLSVISSFVAFSAFAQAIEGDDMYFNAKDRAKLKAQKPVEEAYVPNSKKSDRIQNDELVYASNVTYSSRNVNPEFAARSNAQAAQFDNEDYFIANYLFKTAPANNLNQFNNNLNNWYTNPMYTTAYMGSAFNSWNSPYYGMNSMYSNSPWYDPFYSNNGFSSSVSFYYGSSYNYGWGGNYNYGNQPYCGGSSWAYGGGYGYNSYGGYGYPSNVIIVNNYGESGGRGVKYGKRPTSGAVVSGHQSNTVSSRSNTGSVDTNNGNGRTYNGGRTSSTVSTQQSAYYNRSWRSAQQTQMNNSNTNNSSNRNWNTNNQQNNSFDYNRSNNSSNNNRSSSFDNGGGNSGATRSHSSSSSSSSGSSGSSGRTRGRD